MSAARFAVFAERATAVLAEARSIQATPYPKEASPDMKMAFVKAQDAATRDIATFEPMLYPPDEPVN